MEEVGVEYATKAENMGRLVNAYLYIHLKGEQVEREVVSVPVHQSPQRLLRSHRVRTRIRVGSHSSVSVICSLHQYAVVCVRSWVLYDVGWHLKSQTQVLIRVGAWWYAERQSRYVVHFESSFPEKSENVHHFADVLTRSRCTVYTFVVVKYEETNRAVLVGLQHSSGSKGVVNWYEFFVFYQLIVDASCVSIGQGYQCEDKQGQLHFQIIIILTRFR